MRRYITICSLLILTVQGLGTETQQDSQVKTSESQSNTSTQTSTASENLETKLSSITLSSFQLYAKSTKSIQVAAFERQRVLNIFQDKNQNDSYTPTLFHDFTGMDAIRVSRRSLKKVHGFIQKLDFRRFVREMNVYARRIPFKKLVTNYRENADGLYYRAGFYLLLRALSFKPTDYFYDMWQAHGVLAVETSLTVFLFAVHLGSDVEHNFNVSYNIVEGESGSVLPRDSKTILCAGITFDTEFDPKIRHYKAVLRDRIRLKNFKQNVTNSVAL